MNDNPVRFSNTPIFDKLVAELGYRRSIAGGPTVLHPVQPVSVQPLHEAPQGQNEDQSDGSWSEVFYDQPNDFINSASSDFYHAHPNAVITNITPKVDEGAVSMVIEAIEPDPFDRERLSFFEGAKAAHDMVNRKKDAENENSIGENIADSLYMKPPTWGDTEE